MYVSDCISVNDCGHLTVGGADTVKLADSFGTPLYVFDDNEISDWAESAVYACQMAGIINGDGKGSFNPQDVAQRAQVATMMSIFHNLYKNKL